MITVELTAAGDLIIGSQIIGATDKDSLGAIEAAVFAVLSEYSLKEQQLETGSDPAREFYM